jgi:hypothetical protein
MSFLNTFRHLLLYLLCSLCYKRIDLFMLLYLLS